MSSDEAPPEEAPPPPPPAAEPPTPAERRAERLFRIEIVKTVFSILATIGSVLAIFFTYTSSDFKDSRASLDSIEARLGESTGFRQAAAAAMLPHYYRYQTVWGEYPFREEIQALLSSYFATVATHERGDDLVPPTSAYPVDRGDLRDDPGVKQQRKENAATHLKLSRDPLHRAMSSAVVSILPQAPGLLQNPAFDRTYLLLWGSFQELAIHNGAGLDLKEARLDKARLTGYWERTEGLLAKLMGAQLDLEMLGYCDFQYAALTNCTGQVQAACFCDWTAVRLLGCDLRVDYWMDGALPQGAFLDSRCQGRLWAHLDLRGGCLVNSTLTAERWNDVALDGALLQGADLSGVQTAVNCSWKGALYDEKTRPPAGVELARAGAVPLTEAGLKKWLETAPETLQASLKDRVL